MYVKCRTLSFSRWEHILPQVVFHFFCPLSTWSVKYPDQQEHNIHWVMKTNWEKPLRALLAFLRTFNKLWRDYISFLRYVCVHVCVSNISGSEIGFQMSGWRPLLCSLQPCCWFLWFHMQVSFSLTAVSFSITQYKKSLLMVFFSCFLLEWTEQCPQRTGHQSVTVYNVCLLPIFSSLLTLTSLFQVLI